MCISVNETEAKNDKRNKKLKLLRNILFEINAKKNIYSNEKKRKEINSWKKWSLMRDNCDMLHVMNIACLFIYDKLSECVWKWNEDLWTDLIGYKWWNYVDAIRKQKRRNITENESESCYLSNLHSRVFLTRSNLFIIFLFACYCLR